MAGCGQLHAFGLANGLRLLLNEDHRLPLVAVHVAYRVGAADEAQGQHGLAHLFEHLMYGGSENLPGSYLSRLFAAGAHDLNGRTTLDSTHYFETVHRDALDFALFAEADRMGRLVPSEATLEKQRRVVLNELRQYRERSRGRFVERIDAECYAAGHPYRHGVIGREADLQALGFDQAREFGRRHYHPANAVLALAGDLTLDEAMRRCEQAFGGLPSGQPTIRAEIPAFSARSFFFDDASPSPQKRLVWQLPAMPSMLDREGLRLFQIALESRLRAECPTGTSPPRVGLAFHRLATRLEFEWNAPDRSALERSFSSFGTLWNWMIDSGFSAVEAEQARQARWRQRLQSLDARSGLAAWMIEGELAQGDAASAFISREQLGAIDPAAVMRRWFAADVAFASPHRTRAAAEPACESGTGTSALTHSQTLDTGLKLTLQARSGAELVSGRLLLSAGASAESAGQMGLAQLCAEGSLHARLDGASLRQRAEVIGCDIRVEVQSDALRLSWSSARAQWRKALALVESLLRIAIDDEAFAAAQSRQLAAIELASTSAEAATQRVLPALLFDAAHAAARIASGLRTSVSALSLDQAIAFKQNAWSLHDAQCVLVGDLDPNEVIEVLKRWNVGSQKTQPAIEAAAPRATKPSVHLLDIPGAQQTLLTVAWALPKPAQETEPALRILDLLLAGSFSSRLNLRLREELGWTYGVRSRLGDISAARRYEIQVWIPVERSCDARDEILRTVAAFRRELVDAETLASLQRGEALRMVGRSERVEDAASEIESRLRLGLDPQRAPDLSTVTAGQLRAIASTLLDPDRATSVFAGDAAHLHERLSAAGIATIPIAADAESLYAR
jgi:zinc protease